MRMFLTGGGQYGLKRITFKAPGWNDAGENDNRVESIVGEISKVYDTAVTIQMAKLKEGTEDQYESDYSGTKVTILIDSIMVISDYKLPKDEPEDEGTGDEIKTTVPDGDTATETPKEDTDK